MVVNKYLKKDEEFAYIRRYKPEIAKALPTFFDEVNKNNEFPERLLTTKNNKFYCDNQCFGYAMTLATAQDLKRNYFF